MAHGEIPRLTIQPPGPSLPPLPPQLPPLASASTHLQAQFSPNLARNNSTPKHQKQQQQQHSPRVAEHHFFTKMPDINSVENDLIKLLNDFSNNRLKQGTSEMHEKLFRKLDSIRDKQEKIAKIHFEQDSRMTELK
jgi:hypothetical protein